MQGFAIVKVEAEREDIVAEFNSYMQRRETTAAFVAGTDGYFRLHCDLSEASSAAVTAFGSFLESSGYQITAIGSATMKEGETGTGFAFTKGDSVSHAVLSTTNVY